MSAPSGAAILLLKVSINLAASPLSNSDVINIGLPKISFNCSRLPLCSLVFNSYISSLANSGYFYIYVLRILHSDNHLYL